MADSDIWNPAPCVTMKLSQYPPESRDVLLTYSTDTEKADPKKAGEQASILAEWHFENIPRCLRAVKGRKLFWSSKKSIARCALINEHSILIRDIGIVVAKEQGDESEAQYLTSTPGVRGQIPIVESFRFPRSSVEYDGQMGGECKYRIRTQIDFAEWQASVGDSQYSGWTGRRKGFPPSHS